MEHEVNVDVDVGETVLAKAQARLTELGFDLGAEATDRAFGDKTRDAIRGFQRRNELQANGLLDPQTRVALLGDPTEGREHIVDRAGGGQEP